MSESVKKSSLNRDTVNNNETIFEFLKRKKQFNLENTINQSQRSSSTKRKVDYDFEDDFPQTRDLTKYRTTEQYNSYTSRPSITPKKIQFEEPEPQPKSAVKVQNQNQPQPQHKRGKSFLSMISPLKHTRPTSALEERDQNQEQQPSSRSGVKVGRSENYSRKNVTKCINSIKEMVNTLNQNIKRVQDRSHGLSVLFKPIFNSISNPSEQQAMLMGDLKNKLKSFETLVEGASIQNSDDVLQEFHKNVEDHLQGELNFLRKELQKQKNESVSVFRKEKNLQVQKLQLEIKKLSKENDLLMRRLEKTENTREKIEEAVTEREISHVEQLERYKLTSEQTIKQLKTKNEELIALLENAQQQSRESEKRYKNQRMFKESVENKFREEIQQITEAKDAYLLNEIMVLKAEFNADIVRMNQLHKVKENELLDRIAKREEELDRKMFQKGCDKQLQAKLMEQANQIKQQNLALKTKSECIVTDMYRLNEELYQHWMALKDIKQLSARLGSYVQYKKIYEELGFNDHLFH